MYATEMRQSTSGSCVVLDLQQGINTIMTKV
jgi:hypothetical protein